MIKKPYLIATFLLQSILTHAQPDNNAIPDSLSNKSYPYFRRNFLSAKGDRFKSAAYANAWLAKAQSEQNNTEIINAYKALLHSSDKNKRIIFADSLLAVAKRSSADGEIGSAYLTRGVAYYSVGKQSAALDNYILADEYISKSKDAYLIHKVKYQIAQTKYYLGFYQEAISLLRECLPYFRDENDRAYLNSLHLLSLCYNSTAHYSQCSLLNNEGLELAREVEIPEMIPYFKQSEGVNQYSVGHYNKAIGLLEEAIPSLAQYEDYPNLMVGYFYIGKCHWKLRQEETALPYLIKVDQTFEEQKYIRPDLRGNYEMLIAFYKRKSDLKSQLFYINRLLSVDSLLNTNYKYLSGKIHKDYDTKKLITEKKVIQDSLQKRQLTDTIIISLMAVVIAVILYRYQANKKQYRKKFEELMAQKTPVQKPLTSYLDSGLDLNKEVAEAILKNLEKFERNHKYLERDMTLPKLAALLNTNQKYVTKVIAFYRGKKTIEYISDLKIDFIVEKLKTESRYRNYTNKALGEEAGFGSTQIFTKTFKNRTGMPPTFFIEALKRELSVSEG